MVIKKKKNLEEVWLAIVDTVLNRMNGTDKSVSDIVTAPDQYKGIDVNISYAKKLMKNLIKNRVILRAKQKNRNLLALNKTYTSWGCG